MVGLTCAFEIMILNHFLCRNKWGRKGLFISSNDPRLRTMLERSTHIPLAVWKIQIKKGVCSHQSDDKILYKEFHMVGHFAPQTSRDCLMSMSLLFP